MRKKRSKNIDDKIVGEIVEILDKWGPEKLTWDSLADAVALNCFRKYTRQALCGYERIRNAFDLVKEKQRDGAHGVQKNMPYRLRMAYDRISRLETENRRLETENNALLLQFVIWAYNAYTRGLDENFLNRPLPKVNRGQTR